MRARRGRRGAEDGPARLPPEERRQGRHQSRARPDLPAHRLHRDGGSGEGSRTTTRRRSAKLQGRGVASGFWFNAGGESSAQVNITEDGNVVVTTGHPDIGGSRAGIANICAELLGIDYRRVSVIIGDTANHRLLEPHRRQPRAVRLLDRGDAVDRTDHQDLARTRRKNLGDRSRGGEVGRRRGASGEPECRPVPAADAEGSCREGARDGRPDRRRRAAQHARARTAASARTSATSRSTSISVSRA